MKKKITKAKPVWSRPKVTWEHPSTSAAESDLIKLTREFEALSAQLADLDEQNQVLESEGAATISDYEDGIKRRYKQREHISRQHRVLQAQFDNVTNLLYSSMSSKTNVANMTNPEICASCLR